MNSFLSLLPLIQLLSGIGLTFAGNYGAVPKNMAGLVTQLESAMAPLFAALASKSATKTEDIQAAIGAGIGMLTVLKAQPGLDAGVIAKIEEQIAAGQAALVAEVAAAKGYDPANYAPVDPLPA